MSGRSVEEIQASGVATLDDVAEYYGHDPSATKVIGALWPQMKEHEKLRLLQPWKFTDTWGTMDQLLVQAVETGRTVPGEVLDAVEADNLFAEDPINLPKTIPALRTRLETPEQ